MDTAPQSSTLENEPGHGGRRPRGDDLFTHPYALSKGLRLLQWTCAAHVKAAISLHCAKCPNLPDFLCLWAINRRKRHHLANCALESSMCMRLLGMTCCFPIPLGLSELLQVDAGAGIEVFFGLLGPRRPSSCPLRRSLCGSKEVMPHAAKFRQGPCPQLCDSRQLGWGGNAVQFFGAPKGQKEQSRTPSCGKC